MMFGDDQLKTFLNIETTFYLGQIEGVEPELHGLLKGHDLGEEAPGREVSVGDGVEEVSDGVVGVGGGQPVGLFHGQVLDTLVRLDGQ